MVILPVKRGCLLILILLIILGILFSSVIIRKLISGNIREQTGIVQTTPMQGGGQTYTDPKTGATINLGINKIPDDFPKDFPIYPNATVSTSQTGNGFWLTMISKDNNEQVTQYYKNAFSTNGWQTIQASATTKGALSWAVSKNNLTGYLTIEQNQKETSIIIVLGKVTE